MRWLLLKDLQILRRSPLLVAMLVLYPILIAALVGFAVTSGPSKPRVALLNEVPEAQNEINVGGERVNIAIGLLAQPDVLLLDEPSTALDPRQRDRLWEFILDLAGGGTTVLYSTHVVQEAERYANTVVVLADGERLYSGSPREFERVVAEEHGGAPDFEAAFVAFLRERGH